MNLRTEISQLNLISNYNQLMKSTRIVRSIFTTIAVFLAFFVLSAQGQMKVGYMNPQTVLDTLPAKQQVEEQLNSFIERKQGELEQQTVTFQQRVAKLQEQAENASSTQQEVLQDSANALNQRLRQHRSQIQQQIQQRRAKLLRPIYTRIDKAIQTVAERHKLEFVFNERTSSGQNIVYYADARQKNITDEVIDELLSNTNGN